MALYDSWRHCPITFELTVLVGSTLAPRIRAPATASPGQSGLAANVAAYEPGYAATYDWTISNGEITSGQGSETITFSVSSRPREADRVMLSVVVHPYGGCTSEAGMASVAIDAPGGRRRPREIPFR